MPGLNSLDSLRAWGYVEGFMPGFGWVSVSSVFEVLPMNNVSAHSNREMTYWQAWFRFWVKSFFNGVYIKDEFNPIPYTTKFKKKLRYCIHFIILFSSAVLLGLLIFSIFNPHLAKAQGAGYNPGNYGSYYNSPPSDPNNPYTAPNYGNSGGNGPINSNPPPPSACTIFLTDKYSTQNAYIYSDDPHTVYSGGIPQHAECERSSTWYPDTWCEVGSILGGIAGGAGIAAGIASTVPTFGASNWATWGGYAAVTSSTSTYMTCDGR